MLSNFIEVYMDNGGKRSFSLRNVLLNTEQIIYAREDEEFGKTVFESQSLPDLDKRTKFTRVSVNRGNMGAEVVIVGALDKIEKEIEKKNKTLLKG